MVENTEWWCCDITGGDDWFVCAMGYGGALDVTEGHTWRQSRHLRLSPEKQSHLPDKQTYMRWSVAESERERLTTNYCAGGQRCAVDKLFVHAFCLSLPAVKKGSCSSGAQRKERKEIEAGERARTGV